MNISIFYVIGLETPIPVPKIGVVEAFDPLKLSAMS